MNKFVNGRRILWAYFRVVIDFLSFERQVIIKQVWTCVAGIRSGYFQSWPDIDLATLGQYPAKTENIPAYSCNPSPYLLNIQRIVKHLLSCQ